MHWRPVGDFQSPRLRAICTAYCAYPKVVFSPHLGRYLLYFSSDSGGRWLSSPLGPWSAPAPISDDSCGGTAQSVSVLPSPTGPVPVELIDLYRSSPGDANPALPDRAKHGDWNQALAGRYWAPLSFDAHGGIKPIACSAATRIPLAHGTRSAAPPVYQPDCRIAAGSSIEQQWRTPARQSRIKLPVFQRASVTDPSLPARTQPPTAVDAPLTVDLVTPTGTAHWTVRPGAVSWAPRSISLTLPRPVARGSRVSLRLRTTATDGCYGVLIGPGTTGRYSAIADGTRRPAPGVQLVVDNP